jgi:hypothetical protein
MQSYIYDFILCYNLNGSKCAQKRENGDREGFPEHPQ